MRLLLRERAGRSQGQWRRLSQPAVVAAWTQGAGDRGDGEEGGDEALFQRACRPAGPAEGLKCGHGTGCLLSGPSPASHVGTRHPVARAQHEVQGLALKRRSRFGGLAHSGSYMATWGPDSFGGTGSELDWAAPGQLGRALVPIPGEHEPRPTGSESGFRLIRVAAALCPGIAPHRRRCPQHQVPTPFSQSLGRAWHPYALA